MDETHEGATAVLDKPNEKSDKPAPVTAEQHKENMDFFHGLIDKLHGHKEKQDAEAALQRISQDAIAKQGGLVSSDYPLREAAGATGKPQSEAEAEVAAPKDMKELPGLDVAMAKYHEDMERMLGEKKKAEAAFGKEPKRITQNAAKVISKWMNFKRRFMRGVLTVFSMVGK